MTKEQFYLELSKLNIKLSDKQKGELSLFCDYLLEYNKHTNLTAIKDQEGVYLKHFYDSLTLIKAVTLTEEKTLLDIGSGAGFPGIVLKIVFPNLRVTLLDSNHKKTDFQKAIIEKLDLKNIEAINERAEDYYKENHKFDIVVARALANMQILTELCLPFVKINGNFIAMKSKLSEELENSKNAIEFLNGSIKEVISFKLPKEESERNLIIITKIKESPTGYPRSYDKILKKPLK